MPALLGVATTLGCDVSAIGMSFFRQDFSAAGMVPILHDTPQQAVRA